jgi:4-amino-4-deoxy-L-arabinose transferase-like glycosyltransferase
MNRSKLILILIVLVAALTRLPLLDQLPNGFTGDEAQQGYSAYSISQTGKDEWGEVLPIFPRGFGDYKPPLLTYLTVPSVAILGLTPFATRLPDAIIGILVVLVTYFLAKQLTGSNEAGLWSAFILSISPWHVQLSRTAFEAGAGVLFFSLGLLFFLKHKDKSYYMILAAISWGLALYSYHSFRVFTILFVAVLVFLFRRTLGKGKLILIALILIFILPLAFNFKSILARSSDVGITSSVTVQGFFASKGVSPSPVLDKIFDNKFNFVKDQFISNYLSYYSPTFFFTGARSDGSYLNFPGFELVYLFELLLWVLAGAFLFSNKNEHRKVLLLWFFLAAVPAALANGSFNANRAPTFLPLVSIISGIGAKNLIDSLSARFTTKRPGFNIGLLAIFVFSFAIFSYFYIVKLPQKPPNNLRYGYDQVFKKTLSVEGQYDQIVMSKAFTEPQIFVGFYEKMSPETYQKSSQDWLRYEKADRLYVDQLESWNLGKYYFEDLDWNRKDKERKKALIIGKPEDFPESVASILDVRDPRGKLLYRLVPTNED